ncbi:MAG: WD40 repeat domain-containing protein [Acidobacteria bacterium]|nr:WD40 repeat domain-containing protein [Acidobacteriota bacterium]
MAPSHPDAAFVVDGFEVPLFEIRGREAFSGEGESQRLGLLRLTKKGAQMSLDRGGHWTTAEAAGERRLFAFDNLLITLAPMDEAFHPTRFQAMALERGVVTKSKKEILPHVPVNPFFHSVVAAFAFGRNEVEGILKYPGTTFVVPFRGVKVGDKWVARSLAVQPFNTQIYHPTGSSTRERGATDLRVNDRKFTQMELDERRLLLGTGAFLNYALEGEPAERLETAMEWDLTQSKDLTAVSDAYKANLGRSIWTKSDEAASFSRESEKAYVGAGLKTWFWAPYENPGNDFLGFAAKARATLDPMRRRVEEAGGAIGLVDENGAPMGAGRAQGITPRGTGSGTTPAGMPRLPLAAFRAGDQMVSVHMPGEVCFWSPDLKSVARRQALNPMEILTAATVSPDGKSFVTVGTLGVKAWDPGNGASTGIYPLDGCNQYWCATYSADGSFIAGGGNDGRTRIWDVRSGRLLGSTVEGGWGISWGSPDSTKHRRQERYVSSVSISLDARLLAEGMATGELKVWDLTDRAKPKKLKGIDTDLGKVWRTQFIHGGKELVALNQSGSFRVFDTATWKVTRKGDSAMPTAISAVFDPSGDGVVTTHTGGRAIRTSLTTASITKEASFPATDLALVAAREGKLFLLSGSAWQETDL